MSIPNNDEGVCTRRIPPSTPSTVEERPLKANGEPRAFIWSSIDAADSSSGVHGGELRRFVLVNGPDCEVGTSIVTRELVEVANDRLSALGGGRSSKSAGGIEGLATA